MKDPATPSSTGRARAATRRSPGIDAPRLDAARESSLMHAKSPLGLAGARPWHCSPRVLRLIVALALSCEEIGAVVRAVVGREDGEAAGEPSSEALRVLIDRVTTDARAARWLARALDVALLTEMCSYRGLCVAALAARWASARAAASARETAALLWASARTPGSPMRFLEERIADDVEMRALRAMAISAKTAVAPHWNSATRLARRAGDRRGDRGLGTIAVAGRGR